MKGEAVLVGIVTAAWLLGGCGDVELELPPQVVPIGALLPLTGDFSSPGTASRTALELAVDDVNEYLASIESNKRVRLVIADTRTDPAEAFDKLRSLAEEGVRIVIGPMTSDELSACKPLADRVRVILITQSAAASSLALAGDNVFRFLPDDEGQAEAGAQFMRHEGVEAVVLFTREGLWGEELSEQSAVRFADAGGTVVGKVTYDPFAFARNDFRAELDELGAMVDQATADFDEGNVAVYLISYGEGVQILQQAAADPSLSAVRWFGTDGFALNHDLLFDAEAADFAIAVEYSAPIFGENDSDRYAEISGEITQALGRTPDTFAVVAYDVMWSIALTINEAADASDVDFLKTALPQVVEFYNGASGRIFLNDAGDRTEGTYDFWTVSADEGDYHWRRTATYEHEEIIPAAAE